MKNKLALGVLIVLLATPAFADGTFSLYPTYWETEDVDSAGGLGVNAAWPMGHVLDFELKASYYEELKNQPLEQVLDGDDPFSSGVTAIPLEAGLRFNLARDAEVWNPYVGAGGTYYALDSDFGNLEDEAGFYASLGSSFGNGVGAEFFAEVAHRWVEATVTDLEPLDEEDNFEGDRVDLNLDGFVANMGVAWKW
jgi:hypothetical protein